MLNNLNAHLLDKPSLVSDYCCVCGKPATNRHHVIIKGMGGTAFKKRIPTVPLCGIGNTSGCHGLAHSGRLFFDYKQWWLYCLMDEPTDYQDALENGEWYRCR